MKTAKNGEQESMEVAGSNAKRLKKIISILIKYQITKGLTPEKLRNIIEELGPTFVKIGQMMSMRRDILPNEYCDELQKLRSHRLLTFWVSGFHLSHRLITFLAPILHSQHDVYTSWV